MGSPCPSAYCNPPTVLSINRSWNQTTSRAPLRGLRCVTLYANGACSCAASDSYLSSWHIFRDVVRSRHERIYVGSTTKPNHSTRPFSLIRTLAGGDDLAEVVDDVHIGGLHEQQSHSNQWSGARGSERDR